MAIKWKLEIPSRKPRTILVVEGEGTPPRLENGAIIFPKGSSQDDIENVLESLFGDMSKPEPEKGDK